MRALARAVTVLTVALLALVASPLVASESPTEVVGSFAWNDSTESHARAITGAFDLTFPVGKHLAFGPVFEYSYVRFEVERAPAPVPLEALAPETETPPPDPGITSSSEGDGSLSVWSFGGRAAFHFSESHNGVYLALSGIIPQHDAEGYLLIPEAGVQFAIGSSAFARVAYQRPYHYSEGDAVDLGSQQVTFGFGIRL